MIAIEVLNQFYYLGLEGIHNSLYLDLYQLGSNIKGKMGTYLCSGRKILNHLLQRPSSMLVQRNLD